MQGQALPKPVARVGSTSTRIKSVLKNHVVSIASAAASVSKRHRLRPCPGHPSAHRLVPHSDRLANAVLALSLACDFRREALGSCGRSIWSVGCERGPAVRSLSLADVLEARDAYHVHLLNLPHVVATAVGRYLKRRVERGTTRPLV